MIHAVPFISQFDETSRSEWKARSCSVACLLMAISFIRNESVSLDDLIDEALLVKGWTPLGWTHDALTIVAHNHGVAAYREEFRSLRADVSTGTFSPSVFAEELLRYGTNKIVSHIEQGGVVIASIHRDWKTSENFHTVLIIGFEKNERGLAGFYYHDPDTEKEMRENKYISLSDFLLGWRKMAVFLGKV